MPIHLDMPASLSSHLTAWIRDMNPKGNESDAEDLKQYLADLVDENTLSRPVIEKRLHDALANFTVSFSRNAIEVCDSSAVTLIVSGPNRESSIQLDSSRFDSSDDISSAAQYAEELELAVWDDGEAEDLVKQWFKLER